MKLEQSFEVAAPLDRVWAALIDVQRVAPCLPGAEISGRNDDGSYNGTFRVKIGPTAAAYVGKLEMEKVDETGHTTTMLANGTDRRGQGGAKATIFSAVKEAGPEATVVEVITEYHITGRLARFGRGGMIEEIGNRLLREFATSLQEMMVAPAEEGAYETFVGMSAVKPEASEAPVAESPASQSRTKEPSGAEKPKRRARRDLAAAADAVAAASQPSGGGEPAPESEAVEAAAEDELAAVVPEASEESEPPAAEAPAPPAPEPEVPEPAPAPEPEVPEPPLPPAPPEPPAAPEPPPPPPPPAVEAEPLDAVALGRTVILDRIKSNPAPLIGLLLLFFLLLRRRRRRS
jgi:carbon monoxide dehydrogenase subunit G